MAASAVPVESFQLYTGVHHGEDDKNLQQVFIESAVDIVQGYIGYNLAVARYKSILNGTGTNELSLRARPIQKILSISVNGEEIEDMESIYFDNNSEFIYYNTGIFPAGKRNIIVEYIAGFGNENDNKDDNNNNSDFPFIDGGNANTVFINEEDYVSGGDSVSIPNTENNNVVKIISIPKIIFLTVLRIASLLQSESDNNIGVTSRSFGEGGQRAFVNYVNFDKYLLPCSKYKLLTV